MTDPEPKRYFYIPTDQQREIWLSEPDGESFFARSSTKYGARFILERLNATSDTPQPCTRLADAIQQYSNDLRRNPSGGDDYPFELLHGVADGLDRILTAFSDTAQQPNMGGSVEGILMRARLYIESDARNEKSPLAIEIVAAIDAALAVQQNGRRE